MAGLYHLTRCSRLTHIIKPPTAKHLTPCLTLSSRIQPRHYSSDNLRKPSPVMETVTGAVRNVQTTITENMGGIAHSLANKEEQFDLSKDVPDQSGKVALITGGSEGIGFATAYTLLKANLAKLFIISLHEDVVDNAVEEIKKDLGSQYADKVVWLPCDMSDLKAVTEVAKKVRDQTDRLDILCLNAARGIMTYQLTEYGVDRHFAVNHLGHVTLTSHLLPLLKKTSKDSTVRIQIQASNAHEQTPEDTKFASLDELNRDLGPMPQYGRAKLTGILYARYLDAHLHAEHPSILINATHPGVVETKMSAEDIHEPYPVGGYAMSVAMKPLKKDIWMGCVSTVYAASATEKSGEYICPPATPEPGSELARNKQLGEQLMKLTREIVKEKFGSESVEKGCPLKDY
ncbi:protochlorophyllide reductase [Exophiala viscosa]|uniref:Protochlorophyllide reductase n=1 Tax=Exophiala viscosa TaxID=2486360 RepID=A0AAN6IHX2_9EURO|nr:protochlorophyllide reductase [Exophiala viscosa]